MARRLASINKPLTGVAPHASPRFIMLLRDVKLDYWADKYDQLEG